MTCIGTTKNPQYFMSPKASTDALAERFGTPLFIYDAQVIRNSFKSLIQGLQYRPLSVYYSIKANSALGILSLLRDLGARADLCSLGDLAFAESAGFRFQDMSFTGSGLGDSEIAYIAARPGIGFVADSISQIERFTAICPGRPFALRVNPGIDAGFHPAVRAGTSESRFGLAPTDIPRAIRLARASKASIAGLHGHLGSDIFHAAPFIQLADTLLELSLSIPSVEWINLGGGLGIPREDPRQAMEMGTLNTELLRIMHHANQTRGGPIRLRIEPGGFLTMSAGKLLVRVTDIKQQGDGSGTFTASVDASSNLLPSAVLYETYHPVEVVTPRRGRSWTRTYSIAGNLMLAGDILARDRLLPEIQIGDLLTFGRCGAYSSSRAATFNNRGRAAEILMDTGWLSPHSFDASRMRTFFGLKLARLLAGNALDHKPFRSSQN